MYRAGAIRQLRQRGLSVSGVGVGSESPTDNILAREAIITRTRESIPSRFRVDSESIPSRVS